jgi:hypothetical protein
MRRFMQVALWFNIALSSVIGFTGYVLNVGPAGISPAEPIHQHELAAIYLGYVVLCFLVLRQFDRDPVWLLAPVVFLVPLWIDSIYELSAGTGPVPPVILRPLLTACYVAGYVVLRRSAQARQPVSPVPAGASR